MSNFKEETHLVILERLVYSLIETTRDAEGIQYKLRDLYIDVNKKFEAGEFDFEDDFWGE